MEKKTLKIYDIAFCWSAYQPKTMAQALEYKQHARSIPAFSHFTHALASFPIQRVQTAPDLACRAAMVLLARPRLTTKATSQPRYLHVVYLGVIRLQREMNRSPTRRKRKSPCPSCVTIQPSPSAPPLRTRYPLPVPEPHCHRMKPTKSIVESFKCLPKERKVPAGDPRSRTHTRLPCTMRGREDMEYRCCKPTEPEKSPLS